MFDLLKHFFPELHIHHNEVFDFYLAVFSFKTKLTFLTVEIPITIQILPKKAKRIKQE